MPRDMNKQREYQRQWMSRRRAEWFAGRICVDCGITERLELDHVIAATKVTHRVWSWAKNRREEELAKCVARCHDCHLLKSKSHDFRQPTHGTRNMYEKHGCRCEPCRSAKRIANARRVRKKK